MKKLLILACNLFLTVEVFGNGEPEYWADRLIEFKPTTVMLEMLIDKQPIQLLDLGGRKYNVIFDVNVQGDISTLPSCVIPSDLSIKLELLNIEYTALTFPEYIDCGDNLSITLSKPYVTYEPKTLYELAMNTVKSHTTEEQRNILPNDLKDKLSN